VTRNEPRSYTPVLLSLVAAIAAAAPVGAQPTKTVHAVRVATPPVIDGVLDDPVWAEAEPITDFHQIRPGDGTPPSEETIVYVLYDDDALYVGARLADSEPELIAANTMRHGVPLGQANDRLVVMLDPFNAGRSGFRFETNANGVRHEMLYQNVSQLNVEWETIWEAAGSIDEQGWRGELRLEYERCNGRTVLARRRHAGPLQVQKSFYPEGAPVCHNIVLHPPGGIVGGDRLRIEMHVHAHLENTVLFPRAAQLAHPSRV